VSKMSKGTKASLLGECAQVAVAINADNRRYLAAKATRAGHQLDHVLGALAELGGVPRDP
jgi:hypothetical protein